MLRTVVSLSMLVWAGVQNAAAQATSEARSFPAP